MPQRSETISPTAHYTGHIWTRNGLSHPAFATHRGRVFYVAMQPSMRTSAALGGPTLEGMLMARHRLIDHRLTEAIESGRVSQVVEIAAGLSPRGWRFAQRFGDRITYTETDLPDMVAIKRRMLKKAGAGSDRHRVERIDALARHGPDSLDGITAELDTTQGVAVITEGLLSYLDSASVTDLWQRIAGNFWQFPHGLYLSDLHLGGENNGAARRVFTTLLGAFVRGRVQHHYVDANDAVTALKAAGFATAALHRPNNWTREIGKLAPGSNLVSVLEATTD